MTKNHSKTDQEYDITPDITLMMKMGQKGYRLWQAISELVDNSWDAREEDIKPLIIEISIDLENGKFVEIRDYGTGMNLEEFSKCLKLAHVDPKKEKVKGKLGKFGLGLKTACTSIGTRIIIKTKYFKDKKDLVHSQEYNEEEFIRNGKWVTKIKSIKDDKFKSGTLIRIEGLEKRGTKLYRNKIERLINYLSLQFDPFIRAGELRILIKNYKRRPEVPEYEWDLLGTPKYPDGKIPIHFKILGKYTVSGWYGWQKKGSIRGYYGFNLFWKKRLVKPFAKIGFPPHPEWAKLVGELHLDDFPVTNDKRDFIWEHKAFIKLTGPEKTYEEYEYKESALHPHLIEGRNKLKAIDKKKREVKNEIKAAKNNELISITKAKELLQYLDKYEKTPEEVKELFNREKIKITKEEKEEREEAKKDVKKALQSGRYDEEEKYKGSTPQKIIDEKFDIEFEEGFIFKVKGKTYTALHETERNGKKSSWFRREIHPNQTVIIITNVDFPLLNLIESDELEFYYHLHMIEGITETILDLNKWPLDKFFETRDHVVREYARWRLEQETKKNLEKKLHKIKQTEPSF